MPREVVSKSKLFEIEVVSEFEASRFEIAFCFDAFRCLILLTRLFVE